MDALRYGTLVAYFLGCLAAVGVNWAMVVIGSQQDHTTCEIDMIPVFLQVSGGIMMVFAVIHLLGCIVLVFAGAGEAPSGENCCMGLIMMFLGCVG